MIVSGINNTSNKIKKPEYSLKEALEKALSEDKIVAKMPPDHKQALAQVLQSQLSQLLS